MTLKKIFAQVACDDLATSSDWYASLFGRDPDIRPMDGLEEWHHGADAGLQLVQDSNRAGLGSVTLIVAGLQDMHDRLSRAGLDVDSVTKGDFASFASMRDPDGNVVVLAEPTAD